MEDLKNLREKITDIDNEMADLFSRRMELVKQVAVYKQHKGLPVLDAKREEQVIAGGIERISDPELTVLYDLLKRNHESFQKLSKQAAGRR